MYARGRNRFPSTTRREEESDKQILNGWCRSIFHDRTNMVPFALICPRWHRRHLQSTIRRFHENKNRPPRAHLLNVGARPIHHRIQRIRLHEICQFVRERQNCDDFPRELHTF